MTGPGSAKSEHTNEEGANHFAEAHGGERPYLLRLINRSLDSRYGKDHQPQGHVHSHHAPVHWRHLFKRPVIRQWVYNGRLFRERANREAAKTELFFDLVFVGIIHQLADGASESATGINLAKFILIFYPSWSIWSDVRTYINTSGTDDVVMRVYMFIIMCLLLGYSANVSAIKVERVGAGGDATSSGTGSTAAAVAVDFVTRSLFSRQENTGGGPSQTGSTGETPAEPRTFAGGYAFAEGFDSALSAAVAYFLTARFLRILIYLIYGYSLPRFRPAHLLQAAALAAISCIYLPLIWISTPKVVVGCASAGIIAELSMRYLVGVYMRLTQKKVIKKGEVGWYVPALNIEHVMERTGLFVILVIGESIINVTFAPLAGSSQFGPHTEYWRAILGLSISFSLIWIYFDADASRVFIHALRRHWFTSVTYSHVHWPLCASLILMSASLARMVNQPEFENMGYRWMFSGALATNVLCLAILGFLHKNLDKVGSALIARPLRLAARLLTALIIVLLPLAPALNSTIKTLAVCAGLLAALVAFEMLGKLGAIGAGWEDMSPKEQLEMEQEEVLADAQADPEFEVEVVDDPHIEEGGDLEEPTAKSQQNGHLAVPPASARGRVRIVSSTSSGKRNAVDALRIAKRNEQLEKAERWKKEVHTLTENERGEDDVGMEEDLGNIQPRDINSNQRWAYAA